MAVCSDNLKNIKFEIVKNKDQVTGNSLRSEIISYFAKKNKIVEMGSDKLNLPVLLPADVPISISHHGNLGAFVYPKHLLY